MAAINTDFASNRKTCRIQLLVFNRASIIIWVFVPRFPAPTQNSEPLYTVLCQFIIAFNILQINTVFTIILFAAVRNWKRLRITFETMFPIGTAINFTDCRAVTCYGLAYKNHNRNAGPMIHRIWYIKTRLRRRIISVVCTGYFIV